jgi:hypothetical protein
VTSAEELREAYMLLHKMCRISRKLFSDQYTKFGMAGIRQLIEIIGRYGRSAEVREEQPEFEI